MKVLMIEDNEETIHGLIDTVDERGWEYEVSTFNNAQDEIIAFDPDVIVMDWMFDDEDAELGKPILENVLSKEFRPVIVFSAHDLSTVLEDIINKFPLINFTRKGCDDSELALIIDEWKESAVALSKLRHNMNTALVESAKALKNFREMETFPEESVVSYMLSKQAIQFFEQIQVGDCPPAWIQYSYPPVTENLLVADVIRFYSEDKDQTVPGIPDEYAVILTPSCDMVNHSSGAFKILIAKCCGKEKVTEVRLKSTENIETGKGRDKVTTLVKELHYGYNKAFVALPQLPNVLPGMTIDLKNVDFMLMADIASSFAVFNKEIQKAYRVASIMSPFREQLVWAHMINSCRPGMPERDITTWAKGILE